MFSWFFRDVHERYLSIEDVDDEPSNSHAKLNNLDKRLKKIEKEFF